MSTDSLHFSFKPRHRLPLILQDERAECGHACVAMISHFWGHKLGIHALRRAHKPSMQGITFREMTQLFEGLGFQTRALRVPLSEFHCIKLPAVLHWNMNHFVVLKQVKKNHVMIHDPATGVLRCSMDEVSQRFTGVVMEVEKTDQVSLLNSDATLSLFGFIEGMLGLRPTLGLLLMLSFTLELLNLTNPLFMQYVTDQVVGVSHLSNLMGLSVGFLGLILMQAWVEIARSQVVLYVSMHLSERFSSVVVKHLLHLPLAFFESRTRGDIQSKVHAIDHIQQKIGADFINTLLDAIMMLFNVVVMYLYSRVLTLIVLASVCLSMLIRFITHASIQTHLASSIHHHAQSASLFLETLQAMTPIKSFLKEGARLNTWRNGNIAALNADIQLTKMQTMVRVANHVLFHVEHVLVISVGATFVLNHQLSMGMLFAFLAYRQLFVNQSSSFIQHMVDYRLLSVQLTRLSDILLHPAEEGEGGLGLIEHVDGELSLKNVSFSYHASSPAVINALTLVIQAGEKVAIIGPSGCGKSTLLKLMMGLLQPDEGQVYIDRVPLGEFGVKKYRALTASVMQEDTLLSGSILDNITFFDESADLEWVYQVATIACIHDTIRQFPMGYETLVGDMGSTLSGGQKQRVLLARALYKKPKILFLDEATSHLDATNEHQMNQSLAKLNITQVIVAHRKETIQQADRVIDIGLLPHPNPLSTSSESSQYVIQSVAKDLLT